MKRSVGILGIGTHLPNGVRKNDWWPEEIVSKWRAKKAAPLDERTRIAPQTEGQRALAAALDAYKNDPFHGAIERRCVEPGTKASAMELDAAKKAIAAAGIDPSEIGLVLTNTVAPDMLVTNNAALLHHNLGLDPSCMAMATEAGCNAIQMQLAIAEPMIASGARKYALLVQCCNVTPLARPEEPLSCWFGDGCTAVVLGPVSEGRGILSHAHRTRGQFHQAIVASVPGGTWYDEGRVQMYSGDRRAARESFLNIADYGTEVVEETLAKTGHRPDQIGFYAAHQPTRWFREVTQKHLGLVNARYVDTFHFTGSMFGANIPFGLDLAQKEGLVRDDDLVLMYAGGAGLTYSSMLMRWGR